MWPLAGGEIVEDGLEEVSDIVGIQADEDGPGLEDNVDGVEVAVGADLFEEDLGSGGEVVRWDLEAVNVPSLQNVLWISLTVSSSAPKLCLTLASTMSAYWPPQLDDTASDFDRIALSSLFDWLKAVL